MTDSPRKVMVDATDLAEILDAFAMLYPKWQATKARLRAQLDATPEPSSDPQEVRRRILKLRADVAESQAVDAAPTDQGDPLCNGWMREPDGVAWWIKADDDGGLHSDIWSWEQAKRHYEQYGDDSWWFPLPSVPGVES